jgi:protein O-mannosyl-transferase
VAPTKIPPLEDINRLKANGHHGFSKNRNATLLVMGIASVLYAATINNGFFNIDDLRYLSESPLRKGLSVEHLLDLCNPWGSFATHTSEFLPVFTLSLGVTDWLTGGVSFGQHAFNLILYAAICGLLFQFLQRHLSFNVALASALIFTCHPLHVETVAWIVARADLLMYFFAIAALLIYTSTHISIRVRVGLALLCWIGATLSKQTPGLFLLLASYLIFFSPSPFRKRFIESIPFACITGIGIVLTFSSGTLERMDPVDIELWERPLYAILLIQRYLWHSLIPTGLSFHYVPFPKLASLPLELSFSFLVVLLSGGWLIYLARKAKAALFLLALFLFPLLPTLQLIPFNIMQSNRYAFLSLLAVVIGLCHVLNRLVSQQLFGFSIGAIILIFSIVSSQQILLWERNVWVWEAALEHSKDPFARYNLGRAYLEENDHAAALREMKEVIRDRPHYHLAYQRAAEALTKSGAMVEGIHILRKGYIETQSPHLNLHLANLLAAQGARTEAATILCDNTITDIGLQKSYAALRQRHQFQCDRIVGEDPNAPGKRKDTP